MKTKHPSLIAMLICTLLLSLTSWQSLASQSPTPDEGPWVVQVSYSTRAELDQILSINSPWHVDPLQQIVVLEVDAGQVQQLQSLGLQVLVDYELSAQLGRLNQRLPEQVNGIPEYPCYRTVEETLDTIQQLAADYPTLASWIDIGDSWEKTEPDGEAGYDLVVLNLTNSAVTDPKPALFVMSSIHAREYTPAELNTRFAEYLLENYGLDADVTWLVDYTDIYLLLQANPDGRKMAETGLWWRKNTNNDYCSDSNSRGADLNRNFSFQWNSCGYDGECSSGYECDIDYRGPEAASEPETQSIEAFLRSIFPDQRPELLTAAAPLTTTGVFVDLHSYGNQVLWPWGFTYTEAPNGDAMQTLGRKLAYWNEYDPFQASSLYPTDGATDDFAYGELGVAAFTWELGTSFFQDCSVFEETILPDNLEALIYAAKASRAPYLLPAGPETDEVTLSANNVLGGDMVLLEAVVDDTHYQNSNGTEATQAIAAAELILDSPPWITTTTPITVALEPADGAFDSPVESVVGTIDSSLLAPGQHTVFVRGRDAAGDWGAVSAVFLTIQEPWMRTVDGQPWAEGATTPAEAGDLVEVTDVLSGTQSLVLTDSWQPDVLAIHSVQVDPIGSASLISTTSALTLTAPITSTRPLTLTRTFELLPGEWDETNVQSDLTADSAWLAEKPFVVRKVVWSWFYLPVLLGP